MGGVQLHFSFKASHATSVAVAGEFNNWSKQTHLMVRVGDRFKLDIEVFEAKSSYEYKYVINGRDWVLDESQDTVADQNGNRNNIYRVN